MERACHEKPTRDARANCAKYSSVYWGLLVPISHESKSRDGCWNASILYRQKNSAWSRFNSLGLVVAPRPWFIQNIRTATQNIKGDGQGCKRWKCEIFSGKKRFMIRTNRLHMFGTLPAFTKYSIEKINDSSLKRTTTVHCKIIRY